MDSVAVLLQVKYLVDDIPETPAVNELLLLAAKETIAFVAGNLAMAVNILVPDKVIGPLKSMPPGVPEADCTKLFTVEPDSIYILLVPLAM